jgi:hypothetical protein
MNLKNIFPILCGLFFFANITHAQETALVVQGKVFEKGSKRPLSGASVAVREIDTLSTVSDENGDFAITLPKAGSYTLIATAFGTEYPETLAIQVEQSNPLPQLTFYLLASAILTEVVVNAERNPNRVSKSILKTEEIKHVAGSGSDPLGALQSLPGVTFTNGSSAPAIRGSGPEDILYYVDGIPVNKLFHVFGNSVFNADLIDNFNLYSAAFAPYYDDAVGAVIDVGLRNPRKDRLGGKINVSLLSADFLVEGPVSSNQAFYFSGRRSYVDLLLGPVTTQGVTVQIPNYSDYLGKYIWDVNENQRFTLYLSGAADSLRLNVSSTAESAQTQPDLIGITSLKDASSTQAITWDSKLATATTNRLIVGRTKQQNDQIQGTFTNVHVSQEIIFAREQLRLSLNDTHELTLASNLNNNRYGLDIRFKNTVCTQFNTGCDLSTSPLVGLKDTVEFFSWDISGQDRWRFAPNLTLIGGVRHSRDNYLKRAYTEPRIGLEWEWSEQTLLSAGWGQHNQIPNGLEVVKNFGNPNLSHIRSDHSVLGISQTINTDWSWKAEAYYKEFTGLVVGVSDPALNYVNGASGSAYGTEWLIKKEATERLSGWLSVTIAKSERRNDLTGESFRFQYDQPVNASLIGKYIISPKWTLSSKWSYTSGKPYTPVIGTNGTYSDGRPIPVYAGINSGTLPDYHRLDLRLSRAYVFNTWKLNTYFELNNVYQRKNVAGYNYGVNYDKKEEVAQFYLPISFGIEGEF